MTTLLMLAPAPVIEMPGDEVILDARFVAGMELHSQLWPGRVVCVLRRGGPPIPDGLRFTRARLGFELVLLDPAAPIPPALLDRASVTYCAADDMRYLDLAGAIRTRIGRLVYTVEQSLAERLAATRDPALPARRQLGARLWNLRHERRLRAALKAADGVHLNGPAAARAYGRLNRNTLVYLDNRIRQTLLARASEQAARAERLARGAPLRLVATGPLTATAGAEDLLAMACLLRNQGLDFTLTILGQGPLEGRLQAGIAALGLTGRVTLRPAGTFDAATLPLLRQQADLALLPRHLPEGPGPYIEAMGCGLPVLGYATPGWARLAASSGGGWAVAPRPERLAAQVRALDGNRAALIAASERARGFAAQTTFEQVFARRMAHLRDLAGIAEPGLT